VPTDGGGRGSKRELDSQHAANSPCKGNLEVVCPDAKVMFQNRRYALWSKKDQAIEDEGKKGVGRGGKASSSYRSGQLRRDLWGLGGMGAVGGGGGGGAKTPFQPTSRQGPRKPTEWKGGSQSQREGSSERSYDTEMISYHRTHKNSSR